MTIYGDLLDLIVCHGSHWFGVEFGVPAVGLRPISIPIAPYQRSMRPRGDLLTEDRQSTFCKAAIEPDQ